MAENTIQLRNDGNVIIVNGVTYFKLVSNFPGDVTKNCGLTGEEIDKNFYFLRGYDIKSVEMDDNNNLVITRVDPAYEPIVIAIGDEIGQPEFDYDPKEGILTIVYPDGRMEQLDGFMVPGKDYKVATDDTINGDGSIYNPLRLSNMEKTGTYVPASEYLDLTDEENTLPTDKGAGYRIVTKEIVDNFGRLYPFEAIDILKERLEEESSEWRIPTKEDWDELLNALECEEYRNHSGMSVGVYGELAGQALKSNDELWAPYPETQGTDAVGFHAYPLGNCAQRDSMMDDPDYDAEGFSKFASFWADTVDGVGNAYAKSVYYSSKKVKQETKGKEARLSIRLVKDYDYGKYNEYETILGQNYKTTLIQSPFDDYDYTKIWTSQNLYDSTPELSGVTSEEWSAATGDIRGEKEMYFMNEFDGYKWIKKPMKEGDSIVISRYEDGNEVVPSHEWRVIDGVLVDTLKALKDEFGDLIDNMAEQISANTEAITEISAQTVANTEWIETVGPEISAITEHLETIDQEIEELSGTTVEEIARLDNTINEFSASTVSGITYLDHNDIKPGKYELSGDSDSEMVIPTKGDEVNDIKISVSNDFFNFGTF